MSLLDKSRHATPSSSTPEDTRLAAEENRIPGAIWLMVVLIAVLDSLVTATSVRQWHLVGMIVLPMVLAVVLALVAELDSQRTGFIHISHQSMERLRIELDSVVPQSK